MPKASGIFVIQEFQRSGDLSAGTASERFEWSAGKDAPDAAKGGARAVPKQPWRLPGKQRTVRTDYPGAKYPSEQVLGPNHEPFTLTGRWDDRWNFDGYAVQEKKRFLAMCRRGNPVRVTFEDEVYEGIITEWEFERRRAWDIRYSFTVSNHGDPAENQPVASAPAPVQSAPQTFDRVLLATQEALRTQSRAPAAAITGTSKVDVDRVLGQVSADLDKLSDQLDTRTGSRALRPITTFKAIATRLRMIQGGAFNVVTKLVQVRSDTELGIKTALTVLNFEAWSRAMRSQSRLVMFESFKGSRDMDRRAEAAPARLYRPHRGESLYAVSRQFYGTPHSWRLIADRNGLRTLKLTGEELLIIPVRGEG